MSHTPFRRNIALDMESPGHVLHLYHGVTSEKHSKVPFIQGSFIRVQCLGAGSPDGECGLP